MEYSQYGEWLVADSDQIYYLGLSDESRQLMGQIVFIELPEVGAKLSAGQPLAVVEAAKLSVEIYMPFAGEVVACHTEINHQLAWFNELSEESLLGWIVKIQCYQ